MWHLRCRVLSPYDSSLPCMTRSLRNSQRRAMATRSLPPDWYHCLSQSNETISSEVKPHWASLFLSATAASAPVAISRCSSTGFCLFILLSFCLRGYAGYSCVHHLLLSSIVLLHCHDAVIVCSPGNPTMTTSNSSGCFALHSDTFVILY